MIVRLTLIATLLPSLLLGDHFKLQIDKPFVLVDPLEYRQPASRLYIAQDEKSKASISLHKEQLDESIENYLKKTKNFIETSFPVTFTSLGEKERTDKKKVSLALIESKDEAPPLKILQAFYKEGSSLYVLAYSASKEHFPIHLDTFQKILDNFCVEPDWSLIQVVETKDAIVSKIKHLAEMQIPASKFTKNREVIKAFKELFSSVPESEQFEYLLSFRDAVYEK